MKVEITKTNVSCELSAQEKQLVEEIKKMHSRIMTAYKVSLSLGIKIGGLLLKQKEKLGHGKWLPWARKNLPFSVRSATNYTNLYTHRDKLKEKKVSDLQSAYRLLSNLNTFNRDKQRTKIRKQRRKIADGNAKYTNSKSTYLNEIICGDNLKVMQEMIDNGMAGKISCIIFSPNYNANLYYGKNFNDCKLYPEYLQDILERFPYYAKLLRKGGRIICIIGGAVNNPHKDTEGDYYHHVVSDLITKVKQVEPSVKFFNEIIWDKSGGGKNPFNNRWGSFGSCKFPISRTCIEHILVWSKEQFELPNETGQESDMTEEEFKSWTWDIWKIGPWSEKGNPSPAAFAPKLITRLIKMYSYPGDVICDPYGGSQITCQTAQKLGRKYIGIELNKNYCRYGKGKLKSA